MPGVPPGGSGGMKQKLICIVTNLFLHQLQSIALRIPILNFFTFIFGDNIEPCDRILLHQGIRNTVDVHTAKCCLKKKNIILREENFKSTRHRDVFFYSTSIAKNLNHVKQLNPNK